MLAGGLHPDEVAAAVRRTGARVVHAHNVNPSLGWRALAAARGAGARVVLHLHNYRLVCAVGTCFNAHGRDCVRCHGPRHPPGRAARLPRQRLRGASSTRPRSRRGSGGSSGRSTRSSSRARSPSSASGRCGAPIDGVPVHVVPQVQRTFAERSAAAAGEHALVAARLSREKGVDVAVEACAARGPAARRRRRRPRRGRGARARRRPRPLRRPGLGGRGGGAAGPRRARDRAVALRGGHAARRGGGDGRGRAGRRDDDGRPARARRRPGRARPARRPDRARRRALARFGTPRRARTACGGCALSAPARRGAARRGLRRRGPAPPAGSGGSAANRGGGLHAALPRSVQLHDRCRRRCRRPADRSAPRGGGRVARRVAHRLLVLFGGSTACSSPSCRQRAAPRSRWRSGGGALSSRDDRPDRDGRGPGGDAQAAAATYRPPGG